MDVSMSWTARSSDQAVIESFLDTRKSTRVNRFHTPPRAQARSAILASLACFSHPIRLHSTRPSVSPPVSEHALTPSARSPALESPHIRVIAMSRGSCTHDDAFLASHTARNVVLDHHHAPIVLGPGVHRVPACSVPGEGWA